jgi:hypothetical protein
VLTNGQPTGVVKEFIDFVMSDECGEIVSSLDYIPVVGK